MIKLMTTPKLATSVSPHGLLAAIFLMAVPLSHAQMPWDPYIIECMEAGGTRAMCFEQLPPDVLAELEAYEAETRERRRAQMAVRRALNPPGGPVFGQASARPAHTANLLLQPKRLEAALPTSVDEPFLLQLFEVHVLEDGSVIRMMRAASEVHDPANEGSLIPFSRPYGDPFYIHADTLSEDSYLRLIRTRSLIYRDYKPTLYDYRPDGTLHVEGYVENQQDFTSHVSDGVRPIALSEPVHIHIVRENDEDTPRFPDYSHNTGFVEGLPPTVSEPQPLDTPFGWHYRIAGIWFTESASERYFFRFYGLDEAGRHLATGYRAFNIDDLRNWNFEIDEVSYAGD